MLRRLQIAWDRTQDLFGRAALAAGLIPIVYWLLQLAVLRIAITTNIILLVCSYVLVGAGVLLVQFLSADDALAEDAQRQQWLNDLNNEETRELKGLVCRGKVRVGQIVFDTIGHKTAFTRRDFVGEWRVEPEHERFLKRWVKRSS